MIRKTLLTLALFAATVLAAGCGADTKDKDKDKAKQIAEQMKNMGKDMAAKGKEAADKAAGEAKEAFLKPIMALFPQIEEKIKGLKGDEGKDATSKFDALKQMIEKLKTALPTDWEGLKDGITKALTELKKLVGIKE